MPIYFTGQTGPALPLNSLQFNNAGAFGGDANLTWVPASGLTNLKHSAFGGDATVDSLNVMNVWETTTATAAGNFAGITANIISDPAANSSTDIFGFQTFASTEVGNIRNHAKIHGFFNGAYHQGSGIVGSLFGQYTDVQNYGGGTVSLCNGVYVLLVNDTGSTVTEFKGLYVDTDNAGTITNWYGNYSKVPGGAGAITNLYQYYGNSLGARATNAYSFWADEQGVFRIKADNTFNSVYQAIPVLYNPQFTKYTAGAANYERIVLGQWSSNVAQIGNEAGGTGVLRALDFIGASAGFPLSATNGQNFAIKILTELTTIAAAATTDTAIQIPANAVVFGVDVRVTVAIPTAATFTVIGAGSATVFNTVAVTVAANSTDKGTKSCPFYNATAQAIRITPDIQPGANSGRLRVTIHYYEVTAATS